MPTSRESEMQRLGEHISLYQTGVIHGMAEAESVNLAYEMYSYTLIVTIPLVLIVGWVALKWQRDCQAPANGES